MKVEYLRNIKMKPYFGDVNIIGISLSQLMYTPSDISIFEIQQNDRPYAGWFNGGLKLVSYNSIKRKKISAELQVGVLGPQSRADQIQIGWHRIINSQNPNGWTHQIGNDLGANIYLNHESQVFENGVINKEKIILDFIPSFDLMAGTVMNKFGAGSIIFLSLINPLEYLSEGNATIGGGIRIKKLDDKANKKGFNKVFFNPNLYKLRLNFYAAPKVRAVLYNATMQGGLFQSENPHALAFNEVNTFYFDMEYGLVFSFRCIDLLYGWAFRSAESIFNPIISGGKYS